MSTQSEANQQFILKASCKAGSGIVAGVSSYLSAQGCYISELAQFDDQDSGQFFMRACFHFEDPTGKDPKALREGFTPVAEKFSMEWQMFDASAPTRTLIMVSKADHCLDDLLYRMHKGELNMEVTAVVSNHQDLRPMVEREGIRFIHLPVTKDNKPEQEKRLLELVDETKSDLVVLARYMQILSDGLCRQLVGRAINIHHSFLPGFKGARPYYQAYDRGVKLIGATAHYVTSDLDEGPIIEQSVKRISHSDSATDMVRKGKDCEVNALAHGVRYHLEDRVIIHHNKTVVFA